MRILCVSPSLFVKMFSDVLHVIRILFFFFFWLRILVRFSSSSLLLIIYFPSSLYSHLKSVNNCQRSLINNNIQTTPWKTGKFGNISIRQSQKDPLLSLFCRKWINLLSTRVCLLRQQKGDIFCQKIWPQEGEHYSYSGLDLAVYGVTTTN